MIADGTVCGRILHLLIDAFQCIGVSEGKASFSGGAAFGEVRITSLWGVMYPPQRRIENIKKMRNTLIQELI